MSDPLYPDPAGRYLRFRLVDTLARWMKLRDRWNRSAEIAELKREVAELKAKMAAMEDRFTKIVWQCRRIVRSVVRQYTGRVNDDEDE